MRNKRRRKKKNISLIPANFYSNLSFELMRRFIFEIEKYVYCLLHAFDRPSSELITKCSSTCHMSVAVTCQSSHASRCHMPVAVTCQSLSHVSRCHMSVAVTCQSLSHASRCHMSVTMCMTRAYRPPRLPSQCIICKQSQSHMWAGSDRHIQQHRL